MHGIHTGDALGTGIDNQLGGKLKVQGSGRSLQRGKTMKKSKTLLVLAFMVCLCALLASCDGSVSSKDDNGNDASDMVYVPQFQLVSASKAIDFKELAKNHGNNGSNNLLVASLQFPSLIGFAETKSSDALLGYTQTILGKDVSITCTKEDDGSYVFEGTTVDDSIYIRTVVKSDNSVDYLEMKKIDICIGEEKNFNWNIAVTEGTVVIEPSKEYQTGTATYYCATKSADGSCTGGYRSLQFYLSNKVAASVLDLAQGYACSNISGFDSFYSTEMDYAGVKAFIECVSTAEKSEINIPSSVLNLTFYLSKDGLYVQNIYRNEKGEPVFPESMEQNSNRATTWNELQDYVSFLTDENWKLKY